MINLLPYYQKKRIKKVQQLRVLVVTFTFLIFLTIAACIFLIPTYITAQVHLSIAKEETAALEKEGTFTNSEEVGALETELQTIAKAFTAEKAFLILEGIEQVMSVKPAGIALNRIAMPDQQNKKIELSGTSADRATLQTYVEALTLIPTVAKVDSPVSNFVKDRNGTFSLLVEFK